MATSSTIKYHINVPVETSEFHVYDVVSMINEALPAPAYSKASVNAWISTKGAEGYRVSVVFNPPFPKNAEALVEAVSAQVAHLGWTLNGPVTAWIHP